MRTCAFKERRQVQIIIEASSQLFNFGKRDEFGSVTKYAGFKEKPLLYISMRIYGATVNIVMKINAKR